MQAVYGPLVHACSLNTTVIVSAHTVKGFDKWPDDEADISAIRGSGAVVASSSVVVLYKKPSPTLGRNIRFLRVGRTRAQIDPPEDRYLTLTPEGFSAVSRLYIGTLAEEMTDRKVQELIETLQPVKNADLRKAWPNRAEELVESLRRLQAAGKVQKTGSGKRGDPFTYQMAVSVPPFPAVPRLETEDKDSVPYPVLEGGNGNGDEELRADQEAVRQAEEALSNGEVQAGIIESPR
jgi:hypothetical protein